MREVCGALSGIFMAAGLLYGYDSPDDKDAKTEHYTRSCLDWQRPYWMLIWRSIPAEHKLAEHSGGV